MKPFAFILATLVIALLFLTTGCTSNQPNTPTGKLVIGVEKLTIAVAVDKVNAAITKNTSLSPGQKQAVTQAVTNLADVIKNPKGSAAARAVWNSTKPLLQEYVNTAKDPVIGQATLDQLSALAEEYIADLEALETAPPPAPATMPAVPASPPPTPANVT